MKDHHHDGAAVTGNVETHDREGVMKGVLLQIVRLFLTRTPDQLIWHIDRVRSVFVLSSAPASSASTLSSSVSRTVNIMIAIRGKLRRISPQALMPPIPGLLMSRRHSLLQQIFDVET